jgi:DNA replication protein DnaC
MPKENAEQVCSVCGGDGVYRVDVPIGDPRFGKLFPCECKAQENAERLQRLSGLTSSERSIRLSDISITDRPGTAEMVQACENFIEYPFRFLTIWGGPGNAKTMALQGVVNRCRELGRVSIYVTMFEIMSSIRSTFNRDKNDLEDDAYSMLKRFEEVPILAIDEFDKIHPTGWALEQLRGLIDRRCRLALDQQAGTLIAMNSNPNLLSSEIYSRLSDGRNQIIYNPDSDIRPLMR